MSNDAEYHSECLTQLFGTPHLPALDVDLATLYRIAATMAGKMSVSGTQEKISLALSPDRSSLEVAASGGRYILKPESSRFSSLSQNEHLTMRLAALASIEVPPLGLIRLKQGSQAYIIKRFDRLEDGTKLHVEDFCQLSGKHVRNKYDGSAELCVRILRKFATEPLIEIQKLFRLLLFNWWVANGDMHLKNFSMMTQDTIRKLAPAYDLVCTRLVIPGDLLALPVGGRKEKLTRRIWLDFAEYCGLPKKTAKNMIVTQIELLDRAIIHIESSFLPDDMKLQYIAIVRENTAILSAT